MVDNSRGIEKLQKVLAAIEAIPMYRYEIGGRICDRDLFAAKLVVEVLIKDLKLEERESEESWV